MCNWYQTALDLGFSTAVPLNPAGLIPMEAVRDMCAADKCRSYGKNWTCPPACGSLEECAARLQGYQNGILLQTVGQLHKTIDTKGYREAETRHLESFGRFCDEIRKVYPNALCLGTGGCRICKECAYPDTCRFPEKAVSSMEAYGLFVTQICKDCNIPYNHGEKTITYTACVLY